MIQLSKSFLILFLLICSAGKLHAQADLFDKGHIAAYANHLFRTGNYEAAALEYERLYVLDSAEGTAYQALRSYRKSGQLEIGINRFSDFFDDLNAVDEKLAIEYAHLLIYASRYPEALTYLEENPNFSSDNKFALASTIQLYQQNWEEAEKAIAGIIDGHPLKDNYTSILKDGKKIKRKKKWVAGLLSVPVPGLGRVYTGNWKDGIISLVFVGTMTWQAYSGFNKKGSSSAYGWVFGTLATGFYFGNIYGSAKAAESRNRRDQLQLIQRIDAAYNSFY